MKVQEKIANALMRVTKTVKGNIIYSNEISRTDRELLLKTNWLQPIIKGWFMLIRPDMEKGETSLWYANYWQFIAKYLGHHFGKNYCLSAESSIDLHSDISTIPSQLIVIVSKGGGSTINLPLQTSILAYKDPKNIPDEREEIKGIQVMNLGYALCKATPTFFIKDSLKIEVALRLIRSSDELLIPILKYGFHSSLNRLIGAYRFLNDNEMAESLEEGLKPFGERISPQNPFIHKEPLTASRAVSPYVARLLSMWKIYRETVIAELPHPKNFDREYYFSQMEEVYKEDAYNSLSIEGYRVDQQLIEKVRNNVWDLDNQWQDKEASNTLAARGYYEAFQEVKKSISKVFDGDNSANILEKDLAKWFQALFSPSVRAGILKPVDIIGYRKFPVYISGSRHIPLPKESLLDAMEALFGCLKDEPQAGVRGILGHFFLGYIHPYMDGNGRIARFMMNFMFASGGYPWTIIHVKNRKEYLAALEEASVNNNIYPFVRFIVNELNNASFG